MLGYSWDNSHAIFSILDINHPLLVLNWNFSKILQTSKILCPELCASFFFVFCFFLFLFCFVVWFFCSIQFECWFRFLKIALFFLKKWKLKGWKLVCKEKCSFCNVSATGTLYIFIKGLRKALKKQLSKYWSLTNISWSRQSWAKHLEENKQKSSKI